MANQGIYHPTFNPNGSKLANDNKKWYETTVSLSSISDCFDASKALTASGYIGTTSARPDGLFYDQVHESDILDLRMNSAKVEDYNRLIDREFNKLVAGTYRGSEGEIETTVVRSFTKTGNFGTNANRFFFGISASAYPELAISPARDGLEVALVGSNGSVYNAKQVLNLQSVGIIHAPYLATQVYIPIDGKNTAATMDTLFPNGTVITVVVSQRTTRTKSNTITHTDIIGSPTNYPTAWKQSGVSGTPLIVAEDGASLLPIGALTTFKLSRKANATPLQVLKSTDSGVTWTALTVTTHYTFSTTTNAITFVTAPASTDLIMVTYQTHTSMAITGVNSEVLAIGDVVASNHVTYGSLLQSLLGKVAVGATNPITISGFKARNYRIDPITLKFSSNATEFPQHDTVSLGGGAVNVPSFKALPHITRSNGKARLQMVFKEMKHNGTTWGDHDNVFDIVDYVSTSTDGNGQTILIGQKYAELPYFIGAGE